MRVGFPNPSRCYEAAGQGVRFWGYDRTLEISFLVGHGALSSFGLLASTDETDCLAAFDANRDRIREVADAVYCRRSKASRVFSYTLTTADF